MKLGQKCKNAESAETSINKDDLIENILFQISLYIYIYREREREIEII